MSPAPRKPYRDPELPPLPPPAPDPTMWWVCKQGHRVLAHRDRCQLCGERNPRFKEAP
jgi:hypothetical protein